VALCALDHSLQNRVDDGCAFAGGECLVEFVDGREQTLVLLIEGGDVYAVLLRPAESGGCSGHVVPPLWNIGH
jgi:hypothetical protein